LCLLISRFLILGIFGEVTIGDGFFEFGSDFYAFFFTEKSEFFLELSESVASEEDSFIRHTWKIVRV
jgi:CRISPR/Cas system CSM-associated protein Csm4 (group 5 of RAMP superfamily)